MDKPSEYIERDFPNNSLRYTHYPSGNTLLQHEYYRYENKLSLWRERRDAFFQQYDPKLPILTASGKPAPISSFEPKTIRIPDIIGFDGYDR